MRPIKFKGSNVIFAKDQPEYNQLPAYKDTEGIVTTCWGMTLKERIKFIFTNKLWLSVMTFNHALQPVFPSLDKPDDLEEL